VARVLLVDDEAQIRSIVRMLLDRMGHEVQEATNGREAVQTFREKHFDVVILDIFMPEKDGLECIGELRKLDKNVKIVAVSGGGSRGMMDPLRVASQMGADAVLLKPFDLSQLRRVIDELLEQIPSA
jgi:two-component system, chemotaxis family, chemotaxis protein CheY